MLRIVFALLLCLLLTSPTLADRRVALVIGNSAYQHTPKLANPKNDAADIAAALTKHRLQVIEGRDLDKTSFERKLREFSAALKGAEAGVFFYAGHGLQVAGHNYLVPIDAKAESEDALDWEMIRVDLIHRTMERATSTNILFLDACRDNPLARNLARSMGARSSHVGRGLAGIESGVGTLISFSTQPGNVALDGQGHNSPFTGALVKHLQSRKDLSAILIDVRNDVIEQSQGKQIPWEHSALRRLFYFNSTLQSEKFVPSEAAGAWRIAERTHNISALEAFIQRFGDTYYGDLAKLRLAELKQAQDAERDRLALLQNEKTPSEGGRPQPSRQDLDKLKQDEKELVGQPKPGTVFRDCPGCPEMVVLPAGSFTMGSMEEEAGRNKNEGPQHKVTVTKPFAIGKYEVTFAEWDACVAAFGCKYKPADQIHVHGPIFPVLVDQGGNRGRRPVVNVSWNDITTEYIPWLLRKTGKNYRLPSEAEWEYAARAGTTTTYFFGDDAKAFCAYANAADATFKEKTKRTDFTANCRDGHAYTAPVGSFKPNAFGLYDVLGNLAEWVQDCYIPYQPAPRDSSPVISPTCTRRVVRGGSFADWSRELRSAARDGLGPAFRDGEFGNTKVGFRVARTLD